MSEEMIANESYATTGQYGSQNMKEFAELMIKDPTIPTTMKSMFWGFLNSETILSRSDNKDRKRAENRFAIIRNLYLMSRPAYSVNILEIMEMQNAQHRNTTENNRSFGGFERQALMTQIKELRSPRATETKDAGFLQGIKKRLGFSDRRDEYGGV